MRVMVLVKATEDSEAGVMPSTELLDALTPELEAQEERIREELADGR